MKLLFDENLSRNLAGRLADLFPGSRHVVEVDLKEAADSEIWEFAKAGHFVIISADSDFFDFATSLGPPPKVVWLRRWTHSTPDAERLIRREAIRINAFGEDTELAVLILDHE